MGITQENQKLKQRHKVLFLSSKSEAFYAGRAIRAGANGFVSKRKDLGEIYNAVEMILTGYSFFPSETLNFINHLGTQRNGYRYAVIKSRGHGTALSGQWIINKEIAEQLLLSNKTIAHTNPIFIPSWVCKALLN
jgi:two-component system response regulator FimZ (fimbrial Z protein)